MMFIPTHVQIEDALAHAETVQPVEACGVIADGLFVPIKNKATAIDAFVMDMPTYLAIKRERTIEAIVHSHVYMAPTPSDADRAMCELCALPWLIVSWPTGKWQVIEPTGFRAPLVGRRWAWGTHDCYGLIRDGMKDLAGVEIPDFNREWLWWQRGENLIETQFAEAGFVTVDDAWKQCDVIGMRIRCPVVNHVGIFLAPDVMLHQMMGRNSVREVYGGVYASATTLHLRHRELMT